MLNYSKITVCPKLHPSNLNISSIPFYSGLCNNFNSAKALKREVRPNSNIYSWQLPFCGINNNSELSDLKDRLGYHRMTTEQAVIVLEH